MKLANPVYLLLLIPIVLALLFYVWGRIGKEASLHFSNVQIVRSSGAHHFSLRRWILALLRLVVFVLLIIAILRPQTGEGKSDQTKEVIDIMISMDISSSMATIDFHPDNRLEAAKIEADHFIRSRPDDRIGLVAFAKTSFTLSPLTTDHEALLSLVKTIQIGMLEDGTAIGVGLANALNRLRESEAKSKVVILLTDGVNNSGEIDPLTAGDIAKELGIRVYTIGMGKDGPSMVPVIDPRYGRRMVQTYTEIDETTLKSISQKTKGAYFRAKDETALRTVFTQIDELEKTEIKINSYTVYQEHYPYFLNLAFWVLIAEVLLAQIIWRKAP